MRASQAEKATPQATGHLGPESDHGGPVAQLPLGVEAGSGEDD